MQNIEFSYLTQIAIFYIQDLYQSMFLIIIQPQITQ